MKPPRQVPLLILLTVLGLPARAEPENPPPVVAPAPTLSAAEILAQRFKLTHARIDALFRSRNSPGSEPDPRQNPFRTAAEASALPPPAVSSADAAPAAPGEIAPAPPADSDDALLQQSVATLKVGGHVVIDGQARLNINKGTYKEGDIITARVHGAPVYLRIRHITANSVTFSYSEAELTLHF